MSVVISAVQPKSCADKINLKAGDVLLTINGQEINDVLDYQFYATDRKLIVAYRDQNGKTHLATVKKGEYDDFGVECATYLMDKQRSCRNKCVFCFIDQLPKGLRESLYFKDDDTRLFVRKLYYANEHFTT